MSKPKSKTEKKIDNNVRLALTQVCDDALVKVDGFEWLTHQANYTNFPASLLVTCVFGTEPALAEATQNGDTLWLQKQIQSRLLKVGVRFKTIDKQIIFDTEELCREESQGDWSVRLQSRRGREVLKNRPQK